MSDSLTTDSTNERIILKDILSLFDVPRNLDATFVYDLCKNSPLPNHDDKNRDTGTFDNGSRRGQTGMRKRQMPSYFYLASKRRDGRNQMDRRIRTTAGIHPLVVEGEGMSVLKLWVKDLEILICVNRMMSVGECGLDSSDNLNSKELKKRSMYSKKN